MEGIYEGTRVVEVATGIAGPYAAMFLADHGADVIKVEAAAGDPYRTQPGFQTVNRNKRSVTLPADAVIPTADLVIVDDPGRAAAVEALNPDAVIIAMPPWGERGPLVDHPASADLLHAATGIAWNQQSYGEVPVQLVVPLVEYGTAMLGALAAAAGLFHRERTGRAATYEVSQVAGAAALQVGEWTEVGVADERPGGSPMGSKGRVPCYRLFQAADGRWLFVACGTARFYERMVRAIGRPDLIGHPEAPSPPWGLLDPDALAFTAPIFEEAFAARPRDEWLTVLADADVPCQPVQTRDDYLASSVVAANDLDVTVDHPDHGPVQMMGVPLVTEAAPGRVISPAPRLGAHDAEVGATLDRRPRPTTGRDGARPLADVEVVDVSSFIAGPVISRHLAMLGADVVKVEPPTGDPFRAMGPMCAAWNQGKRSIALDLGTDEGQTTLHRLVEQADVMIENFRPTVSRRLGVTADDLRARNDDLVIVSSPGYGSDPSMEAVPAFDPLLQALGGIMAAQGGDAEPVFITVPVHDVCTPLIAAFGAVTALHHRHRTGTAQRVRTSLAHTAMATQAAEFTRFAGAPTPPAGGFDHAGPDEHHTWRQTDDGTLEWVDGPHRVPVARAGLICEDLAAANDLLTAYDHPEFGPIVHYGQLVGGAGAAPGRSPTLDEHGAEIRSELADGPAG